MKNVNNINYGNEQQQTPGGRLGSEIREATGEIRNEVHQRESGIQALQANGNGMQSPENHTGLDSDYDPIEDTKAFWEPRLGKKLTDFEAEQIASDFTALIDLLGGGASDDMAKSATNEADDYRLPSNEDPISEAKPAWGKEAS